jgi:hypothetical protein
MMKPAKEGPNRFKFSVVHLEPLALAELRLEWDERRSRWRDTVGHGERQLRLAKDRLERTRRLFFACDPEHGEANAILEAELDAQALAVKRLEEAALNDREQVPEPFTERLWEELQRLPLKACPILHALQRWTGALCPAEPTPL